MGVRRGWSAVNGHELFVAVHEPDASASASASPSPSSAAVVVCPPLFAEAVRNYRKETALAEALAERGVAAVRFHYHGAGHSGGEAEELSLDDMMADAAGVAERTRASGGGRLGLVGTRLGAGVAAHAAAAAGADAVVLWDAVLSGPGYLRELKRAVQIAALRQPGMRRDVIAEAEAEGAADVLGYPLTRRLARQLEAFVVDGIDPPAAHVLFVELGLAGAARAAVEAVRGPWGADVRLVGLEEGSWFTGDAWSVDEADPHWRELIEGTAVWLTQQLGSSN